MRVTAKGPPAVILLAEDDIGDQIITQEALKSLKVPYELRVVSDGEEALDYLYRQGRYQSMPAPDPDLLLLDWNMPRVHGRQVAERMHSDPRLRTIPVVVLTTSRREEDVLQSYGNGVASFITKPLDFQQFTAIVRDLEILIRFLLEIRNLRNRPRLTGRRIRRLARRWQQLQRLLFDRHMRQIEAIFACCAAAPAPAGPAEPPPAARRLADKLLQAETGRRHPAGQGSRSAGAARGLQRLARALAAMQHQAEPARPRNRRQDD
jgi:CheY-like chemotaxis protein